MNAKKIPIRTCDKCPSKDHKGGFAKVSYIPICRKTGKELPYEVSVGNRDLVTARATDAIPDWCPLDCDEGAYFDYGRLHALRVEPSEACDIYLVDLNSTTLIRSDIWHGSEQQKRLLGLGLIFADELLAKRHGLNLINLLESSQ